MSEAFEKIKQCEDRIEDGLRLHEMTGEIEKALVIYQDIETQLEALHIPSSDPAYAEGQRVLAYCLMRQGNILRELGDSQEALLLRVREIAAAGASGDPVTIARSLMSNGTNQIVAGKVEHSTGLLKEARSLFESGNSYDHKQGLGWYWILQADMMNAGLIAGSPSEVIGAAERALSLLLPIQNWPGVVRAQAARAQAHERLGNTLAADADREAQLRYESKIDPVENLQESS
jgi:tetratricopeptide (TPR) repeat protein